MSHMNHKRLLSALAKVGATISNPNSNRPSYFVAEGKNGNKVVWYAKPKWDKPEELEASCVHAPDPQTDIMTDLLMDVHFDTIRSAAHELSR